jgi:hypothetical protein
MSRVLVRATDERERPVEAVIVKVDGVEAR